MNFCYQGGTNTLIQADTDLQGNLVIAGTTRNPMSFPLVSPLISNAGPVAGYVIKLDSQLKKILFSTLLGGSKPEVIGQGTNTTALAVDHTGNIYVGGETWDSDFPVTAGAYQKTPPLSNGPMTTTFMFATYLTAISSAGDRILYSTFFIGETCNHFPSCNLTPQFPSITQIAVDGAGSVVLPGYSTGQLPVTPGVLGSSCQCPSQMQTSFVAKFAPGGSQLPWATYINSADVEALALDSSGNVVIGGQALQGFTPTSGALQSIDPGGSDTQPGNTVSHSYPGFVAKIDASAQRYVFATFLGGNNFLEIISTNGIFDGTNGVTALGIDSNGTIWATGGSLSSELPCRVPCRFSAQRT